MTAVDVSLEFEADGRCAIKLQTPSWELNVRGSADEFMGLVAIRETDWNGRRSLNIGEVAGSRAFWASDGTAATVGVGHDDETWDVAFAMPIAVVDEIVRLVSAGP